MLRIFVFSISKLCLLNLLIYLTLCIADLKYLYALTTNNPVNYFNITLQDPSINKSNTFSFKADNISYNAKLNLLIATGNIEIIQDGNTIKADEAYIEKNKQYIVAKGNIYLKDSYNKEIFADYIEIQNSFNNALIENIQMLFSDNTLLSANKIVKKDNLITTYNTSYTACPFGKFFTPFWSIKAKKMTYNQEKHVFYIYNGWLQIKNIPIIWLPYASYSDPKIKRRYGLLTPHLGKSSVLGYYYLQPIFFPLNIHTDLNLKFIYYQPKLPFFKDDKSFTQSSRLLLQADYLSYFKNGEINLKSSYMPFDNKEWAIFSNFKKNLTDTLRIEGNFDDATSRNFLTLYKINDYSNRESFLWKNIKLENFLTDKDYLQFNIYRHKNINPKINKSNNPYILPEFIFKHFGNTHKLGSFNTYIRYTNFLIENNYKNYDTSSELNNVNLQKFSLQAKHNITKFTSWGVYSLDTQLQNVNYYKAFIDNIRMSKGIFDTYIGGSISAKAEYPIITRLGDSSSILNPIVQYNYSSIFLRKKHNLNYLDPTTINMNILNLFENNKYSGFDCYPNGSRINYALQWDLINKSGFCGQMLVGQSIDLSKNNKSNFLIYLAIQPTPLIKINYTSLINHKLTHFEQNNLNLYLGTNLLGTYLSYRSIQNLDYAIYNTYSLEELQPILYIRLSKNLFLNTTATFNLKNKTNFSIKSLKHLQSFDSIIIWENPCFSFSIKISRSFYGNLEIKPSNSYQFGFVLKNIGGSRIKIIDEEHYNIFLN